MHTDSSGQDGRGNLACNVQHGGHAQRGWCDWRHSAASEPGLGLGRAALHGLQPWWRRPQEFPVPGTLLQKPDNDACLSPVQFYEDLRVLWRGWDKLRKLSRCEVRRQNVLLKAHQINGGGSPHVRRQLLSRSGVLPTGRPMQFGLQLLHTCTHSAAVEDTAVCHVPTRQQRTVAQLPGRRDRAGVLRHGAGRANRRAGPQREADSARLLLALLPDVPDGASVRLGLWLLPQQSDDGVHERHEECAA